METRLGAVFDILRHRQTLCPVTVAVYGDWGTGKTSAMRWLQTQLHAWNKLPAAQRHSHPCVYPVWFDPWKYHTREEVWRGIIAEVILAFFRVEKLDAANFKTRLTEAAKRFGGFLGRGFLHALANMDLELGPADGTSVKISGEMFSHIYDEFQNANHPEKAHLNQFEETLHDWVKRYLQDGARLALFIDDLDRCLPNVTLEVLEALKLYLNIPQLVFVVGLDKTVVNSIVAKHYKEQGLDEGKSRKYLDKIFQVEVQVAPSAAQMKDYLQQQIAALNTSTGKYWERQLAGTTSEKPLREGIGQLAWHNPREIKRLLNSALLRGRTAVDSHPFLPEANGIPSAQEKERFAQGVQVFLVQRYISQWVSKPANMFLDPTCLEWFEIFSLALISKPDFKVPQRKKGNGAEQVEQKLTSHSLPLFERSYELLMQKRPRDDDFNDIALSVFENADLWSLLRAVPFSKAVAEQAPKVEVSAPVPASGGRETDASPLAGLPVWLRDRIAAKLEKPVAELATTDLAVVTQLDLEGSPVTDTDLPHLANLTGLQWLVLTDTRVTDAGLAHLTKLTALQALGLAGTKVGGNGLVHLANLTSLQRLILSDAPVTDGGLAHLSKFTNLETLSLGGTKITNAGLAHLTKLIALQTLDIRRTEVTDAGMELLATLTGLQSLFLSGTQITDAGLGQLLHLTALKVLDLRRTHVTDTGLTHLASLIHLKDLFLSGTQVTDGGILRLKLQSKHRLNILR